MNTPANTRQYSQMPKVNQTRVVNQNECQTVLRQQRWDEKTISLLYRQGPPARVQIGDLMLIVKG